LADTKFEFGMLDGEIVLIDECMTPDSSRYWPSESYRPGSSPPSFDKQYVRDYMEATGWNKEPPAPSLPADVIANTRSKYVEAYEMITGLSFADWYRPGD
jgi:phosphoribosylaminoimidazole-succinocarboxamide synthase